jgi:putative peptidoglycan lipid II flippase
LSLFKSIGIITVIAILSKFLGFFREAVIANYFGASNLTDSYFVAYMIPTLMFTALGMAISTGIMPIYINEKKENEKKATEIVSVLFTIFIIITIAIILISYFYAYELTSLIAPGFDEDQLLLTTKLTKIMLPSLLFFVLASLATGILHANNKFVAASMMSIPQNLAIIIAIIFFSNKYGITGLIVGTFIGTVLRYLILHPQFRKYKIGLNFSFKKNKEVIKSSFKLFTPIIIASIALQLNGVVDRMIASDLEAGSVSALNYGNTLMYLPLGVIVMSIITVLYPLVVKKAKENSKAFMDISLKGIITISYVAIPIFIIMIISKESIINITLKRGAFDEDAARLTVQAFYFYCFGMIFIALKDYLMKCFVAIDNTRITMTSSVLSVLCNIFLSFLLAKVMGVGGIALATSIAMGIQTIILLSVLIIKVPIEKMVLRKFVIDLLKLSIALVTTYFIASISYSYFNGLNDILSFFVIGIIVVILYLSVSMVIKIEEIYIVMRLISQKFKK